MRWMAFRWLIVCTACGHDGSVADAPATQDASVAKGGWLVAVVSRPAASPVLAIVSYDASSLATACPEQTVNTAFTSLAAHATLPYVYGVETGLTGIALGCSGLTTTSSPTLGQSLALRQRIALLPSGIGFFTVRNDLSRESLWRFTIASDGVPTVGAEVHSGPGTGALAVDAMARQVFTGSNSAIFEYPLAGAALDLPTMYMAHTTSCASSVDIALSGNYALAFCADAGDIRRFTRTPLAADGTAGSIGVMDRVIALADDRAIGARSAPPGLVAITLAGGTPTWVDGPALGSRITAMAVSRDSTTLFTARQLDAATSELASWSIAADTITPIATQMITGTVTALAESAPGT